jgi:hypothetical protein
MMFACEVSRCLAMFDNSCAKVRANVQEALYTLNFELNLLELRRLNFRNLCEFQMHFVIENVQPDCRLPTADCRLPTAYSWSIILSIAKISILYALDFA